MNGIYEGTRPSAEARRIDGYFSSSEMADKLACSTKLNENTEIVTHNKVSMFG